MQNLFSRLFKPYNEEAPKKALYFFNTYSREKELFKPIKPGEVRMYNCGPTVYNYPHIGNFRSFIFADVLRRVLEYNDYEVKQVMNITDVGHLTSDADEGEDKLEKRAREVGSSVKDIVRKSTKVFFDNLKSLNAKWSQTEFPKATDYINEQIAFVKTLEEKGYTYEISDGIYFDTSKFINYGKLGNVDIEGLREGARVPENPEKLNQTDFALWKFSRPNENRQQEWKSPWGVGFPGWHLECSAMALKLLGRKLDIHTGGIDHIPTHHNNEIAQTESVTGEKFVRYWLHNEFIMIDGKRISKSLGNSIYIRDLKKRGISPLAYRYWLMTSHYRSKINFTWSALDGAKTALFRLHRFFIEDLGRKNGNVLQAYQVKFHEYINDDLDTPRAVSLLHDIMGDETVSNEDKRATFLNFDLVLGIGFGESDKQLVENLSGEKQITLDEATKKVQKLLEMRNRAREDKNWVEADRIRDEISSMGYKIVDDRKGPKLVKGK